MLYAFLAVGGFWFYTLAALAVLFVVWAVENDKWGKALIVLLATLGLLALCGDFNIFKYIWNYPYKSAMWVGFYTLAGALWSIVKWTFFVLGRRDKYKELKAKFLTNIGLNVNDNIPENQKGYFTKLCENPFNDLYNLHERPKASKYKSKITTWIAYWPWSVIWTLIGDVLKRLATWTYTFLHDLYEGISRSLYKEVENDLADSLVAKKKVD